jgi:hypothetical protein
MDEATVSDQIRALEERLLEPTVRKSRSALERLLADEFVEFASDGHVYDKDEVISALQLELPLRRSIADFAIQSLSTEIVLATYKVSRADQASGEIVRSLRSSVWRRAGDGWQLIFHQGTICPLPQGFG